MNTLSAARTLAEKATTAYQSVDGFLKCEGISDAPVTLAYRFNSPGAAEQFKFSQDITHAPGVRTISLSDGCLVMETRPDPQSAQATLTEAPTTAIRKIVIRVKDKFFEKPGCLRIAFGVFCILMASSHTGKYFDAQKDAESTWASLQKPTPQSMSTVLLLKMDAEKLRYSSVVEMMTAWNRESGKDNAIFFLILAGGCLGPNAWQRYKEFKSKQPNKLPEKQ